MTIIASVGTKLSVTSREPVGEELIITPGDTYEANYDIPQDLTRIQSLELVRQIRQRSYGYSEAVSVLYAGVEQNSPQVLTVQFKALSSHLCPFVVSIGFLLGVIIVGAAAVVVGVVGGILLKGLDRVVAGVTVPFAPVTTTTYIDPETGDEYGTYEEYVYAWEQRHPGTIPPEPGTVDTTSAPWSTAVIGLVVLTFFLLLGVFLYQKYFKGTITKAAKAVGKQKTGGKKK